MDPKFVSEDLKQFCTRKDCRVIACRLMPSKGYGTVRVRLVVQAQDGQKIEAMQWPDNVFTRPWHFTPEGKSENRTRHSDSLDTLLYVWFAAQNLEFYEWKLRDHGWALSCHRTHTIFAP